MDAQAFELLVQGLSRLDESSAEDAKGVYNTLAVIENVCELRPSLCEQLCSGTSIMQFLLRRLKVRTFDGNKLYARYGRCRVQGVGCRVQGAGCRVQGAGCRVQGAGCRV